jgi:hypothetical protein
MLRRANCGIYKYINISYDFKFIDFDVRVGPDEPAALERPRYLEVRLKRPLHVDAMRVDCSLDYRGTLFRPVTCHASWSGGGRNDSDEDGQRGALWFANRPGARTAAVWINDTVESIRIYSDPSLWDSSRSKNDDKVIFNIKSIKILTRSSKLASEVNASASVSTSAAP